MLHNLKRRIWPHRAAKQFGSTEFGANETDMGQLQAELEQLTAQVLQRADVCLTCVSITIEHAGTAEDQLPVLRSMIALARWDTKPAMRLVLGLAHIERAMHRAVATSWFSHAAHFGGV